jgi:tetratricopeptide (TPR) repeat protein
MSTDEKSDIPVPVIQTSFKCHYTYEPTIRQTQLTIEVPDEAKISNELSGLIEKLQHKDEALSSREDELYKQLVSSIPLPQGDGNITARPLLERRNVVIKIIRSSYENSYSNLTGLVDHFKPKRLEELREKINQLRQKTPDLILCAITGVAGCGKSELAKAYTLELYKSLCVFTWRLDPDPDSSDNKSNSAALYKGAYSKLLYNFGVQESKAYDHETPEQIHQRTLLILWKRISQYREWVLIFDNAGTYDDIKQYLPIDLSIQGLIIITSQNSYFLKRNIEANFSINQGLDQNEAIQLLKELSKRQEETEIVSLNVVKDLDFSPLAIRIAGCYIRNVNITFERYTQLLKKNVHESRVHMIGGSSFISQSTQDNNRTITLETAIQISLKKVEESNPFLLDVLKYCGYLANEDIPLNLLIELCNSTLPKDREDIEEELKILMTGNNNYSLLTYNEEKKSCYLHRSTQATIRNIISSPTEIIRKAMVSTLGLYPFNEYLIDSLKICKEMIPHFFALTQHVISNPVTTQLLITEISNVFLVLGQLGYQFSQYSLGTQCLQDGWKLTQMSSNINLPIQIKILRYMGQIKYLSGEYRKSRQYLEKALKIGKIAYKLIDWELAQVYNRLAQTLRLEPTSSVAEALETFQQAKQICMKCISSTDAQLQLAFTYRGIGYCLRDNKQFEQALSYFNQSVNLYELYVGNTHPFTASVYQAIGTLGLFTSQENFANVGVDYHASVKYLERSLPVYISAYGATSNHVADSYDGLSRLLYTSGDRKDWECALEYRNHVIEIYLQIWGETSQNLISSYGLKDKILQKLSSNLDIKTS